jgi:diaminopimelate decarboxylase
MNDLIRPALYQARHRIEPLEVAPPGEGEGRTMRVVGPVCESSDDFGSYAMPRGALAHVVIRDAGAYGFTMASEYNGRPLPIEVFLDEGRVAATITPRRASAWIAERLGSRPT